MSEKRISRKELARQNRKKSRKRKNIRNLMIVAVTAVLVYITGIYGASLAYFGDFISSGMTVLQVGGGFPVEDDFSTTLQVENMGTGLAVLTPDDFTVYSPTGKNVFTYSHAMQSPVMDTSQNRAVVYNLNRTSLKILNGHNLLFSKEMDNNIIHAEISDSNRVAVTTRSASYNGEVTVYNFNMEQRFVWYCATGFPVYSVLSDSGKTMAVCAVQTKDGLLQSDIYVIDAAQGNEKFTISSGDYPVRLEFLDDSRLLIAYSDSLVLWDTQSGTQVAEYGFAPYSILALETTGTYIALATGSYTPGTASNIVLLSHDFTEKLNVSLPDSAKDVSLSRSRLYALCSEKMYEYDYSAALLNTTDTGSLSRQLVTWNGTMLVTSTGIEKVDKTKSR